ncbi:MAG: MoaD/ThiS family protein [Pyrinomonadaceae bacterium]
MKVRVLFFGATADAAAVREVQLEIGSDETLADVADRIKRRYEPLLKMRLLFAVNEEYVEGDRVLRDGDAVALFTQVSGG